MVICTGMKRAQRYIIKWRKQGTEEEVLCDPICGKKKRMNGYTHTLIHTLSDKMYQRLSLIVVHRVWAGMEKDNAFLIPIFKPCAYVTLILNSSIFNN